MSNVVVLLGAVLICLAYGRSQRKALNARFDLARLDYERRLRHLARHDPVTELPNRTMFRERLTAALEHGRRRATDRHQVAVLIVDLDRFKVVNESLGHTAGDRVLRGVATRLAACLRPGDTIARYGGDEFGILLAGVTTADEASTVATRLQAALREPLTLGHRQLFVAACIGVTIGAPDPAHADELLCQAGIALSRARFAGCGSLVVFQPEMTGSAAERLDRETELRHAAARGELRLHFQPEVNLGSGEIVGFEALARWQHPRFGLVSPLDFIPLAEETGLIVPIGEWVLTEACRQSRAWPDPPAGRPPLVVSVNVSARQLVRPNLAAVVSDVLRETGLPPHRLRLELTESVVTDDIDLAARTLQGLKDLGVGLAIDDFGTGYSSLSHLRRLPVDTVKVDRSFVRPLGEGGESAALVQAILGVGHALGMAVTVEGIETAHHLTALREIGVTRGQGYLFAPPLPGDEVATLLMPPTPYPISAAPLGSPASAGRDEPARPPLPRAAAPVPPHHRLAC